MTAAEILDVRKEVLALDFPRLERIWSTWSRRSKTRRGGLGIFILMKNSAPAWMGTGKVANIGNDSMLLC
ncbi:uncharacterized protein LACBIDRAFT_297413 [Laccaria bicolor S238N-H82]|uniref:Predicted protein n=1 Tax=Laccaria bicolor (strain S238N-H82 / ATCC MYA-4686) TaxID=486041 RepID=B0E1C2_LACBS|nr:uncharacterized protein LACBIDRAFT_316640 [Laccaria bicolor S238N-H82]XP_001890647.1 uncharacterized protein LACBIDRAFT_297413 [Laccaria bicolor S238N-H82]EDQ98701.1 predicted protein [Laccaria bicolor S238N-H82]EDQ99340.1 predicted protein [Laccaria bicolor S238N-H82]|eukprot:XP_001889986.1 predicted protein [Laccaria bicolor S238N-H82]